MTPAFRFTVAYAAIVTGLICAITGNEGFGAGLFIIGVVGLMLTR